MKRRERKKTFIYLLIILLVSISIGYAFLTQELSINGTGKVTANNWSIYFDNIVFNNENVALSTGDSAAVINPTTLTDVTYTITLQKPGDFYEFTVDVVNDGSLDAMVNTVSNKLGGVEIDATHPLPNYLNYSVTYSDGIAIAPNHLLEHGETETYKVRLEYRKDISANDLPSTAQTLTLNFSVEYVQADGNAVVRPVPSFANDSWETIVANVHNGTIPEYYTVGSTKEIELGNGLGTHTIRIANMSTPAECSTEGFSQTACGFVLEFADIITMNRMNPEVSGTTVGTGNIGGWPVSEMRTYLNDTDNSTSIINSLPEVLRNAILDTTVVSGHGSTSGETNFISTDKLYLLSDHEIWVDVDEDPETGLDYYETSYYNTRQLDYYNSLGVTSVNPSEATKYNYNETPSYRCGWWLRTGHIYNNYAFRIVNFEGHFINDYSYFDHGISPAFRIG